MRTRGGCRLEQVKSKCFEARHVGALEHCSSLEDVIWSYVGWWAKWGWVNWGQWVTLKWGGLSWEVEERNGRLPLILTLRLWVKQRDSPPRTGIKWVLCSCPSMEKHSAQTGDLPHCLQGVCRKEGWYFLELRYLILTVTAVSTLGSEATMLQKCSTTYFKHNLGNFKWRLHFWCW